MKVLLVFLVCLLCFPTEMGTETVSVCEDTVEEYPMPPIGTVTVTYTECFYQRSK